MKKQHDLTGKDETIMIPGMTEIRGFHHYFATAPNSINGGRVIRVKQVHGNNILIVGQDIKNRDLFNSSGISNNGYDAIITDQSGIVLEVRTADCLPILIVDPKVRIIAAIHAGWRGSLLNLAEKVVMKMEGLFGTDPEDLCVGFGPSIGPCCYEVGDDILDPVRERYQDCMDIISNREDGKGMFNLEGFNRKELLALGIREERIFSVNICTSCHPIRLPSFRRDGRVEASIYAGIMIETV